MSRIKGSHISEEAKKKISEFHKGKKRSEQTKKKISDSMKGMMHGHKFQKGDQPFLGMKASEACKKKRSAYFLSLGENHWSKRPEVRLKMSIAKKGEKAPKWKGGVTQDVEYMKKAARDYRNAHRAQFAFYSEKRRALKANAEGSHTFGEWDNLKIQYNWTCPRCHKREPEIVLTEDHIIPLSKGGSNNIENIQPLCKSCNSWKYTKTIKFDIYTQQTLEI